MKTTAELMENLRRNLAWLHAQEVATRSGAQSWKQVAERADVPYTSLSRIRHGETKSAVSLENVERLAEYYGTVPLLLLSNLPGDALRDQRIIRIIRKFATSPPAMQDAIHSVASLQDGIDVELPVMRKPISDDLPPSK